MRSPTRPALIVLLVVLLTTWGTCPCTMAKVFGIDGDAPKTAAVHVHGEVVDVPATSCCCQCCPQTDGEDAPAHDAPEDECPCCASGGCLRDLPPQGDAFALEMPVEAAFDLPLDGATAMLVLPPQEVAAADPGPATDWRPHAAPVGIVRILS